MECEWVWSTSISHNFVIQPCPKSWCRRMLCLTERLNSTSLPSVLHYCTISWKFTRKNKTSSWNKSKKLILVYLKSNTSLFKDTRATRKVLTSPSLGPADSPHLSCYECRWFGNQVDETVGWGHQQYYWPSHSSEEVLKGKQTFWHWNRYTFPFVGLLRTWPRDLT